MNEYINDLIQFFISSKVLSKHVICIYTYRYTYLVDENLQIQLKWAYFDPNSSKIYYISVNLQSTVTSCCKFWMRRSEDRSFYKNSNNYLV